MNRQTKRLLQRRGQLAPDGSFVPKAPTRPPIQEAPSGPSRPLPERVIEYFKDVRAELRKVAWGTRTEVLNFFLLVTVGVIFIGVVVFAIDFGVNKLIEFLFSK